MRYTVAFDLSLVLYEIGSCSVVVLLKKVVFLLYDMVTVCDGS